MCEEKKVKIFLIKAENAVNSSAMNKFSNEKQGGGLNFFICAIVFSKGSLRFERLKEKEWK